MKSIPPTDPKISQAIVLHQQGRLEDAAKLIQEVLLVYPKNHELLTRLGTIYLQKGENQPGIDLLDRSLQVEPRQPMALFNRANVLMVMGKMPEALAGYDRVITIQPTHVEAHFNRATLLIQMNRPEEALVSYDQVITLKPNWALAHYDRGWALQKLQRNEEALTCYSRVIEIEPNRAEAFNSRGVVLRALGRFEEALADHDQAILFKSDLAEAHNNRGTVLQELGRFEEASISYDRAIATRKSYAEAYFNKALLKLLAGCYEEGWRLYEWRWNHRKFHKPIWSFSESIEGKTLLVPAEHGLGDIIQYARYAKLLEERGAKVILEVPTTLLSLFSTMGSTVLQEAGTSFPDFDLFCPLMSLPLAFGTTVETIPAKVPYLFPDKEKTKVWTDKLGVKTRPRVGLVWSGNPAHTNDHNRSIILENLKPLLELPLEFHSLQKEYRQKDAALLKSLPLKDHQTELKDFSDTAALVHEIDLVVSVDTSTVHLAGALGKPVWVLLPFLPDYRWFLQRTDSPWYPTATLFRQTQRGEWEKVIQEVKLRLSEKFVKS